MQAFEKIKIEKRVGEPPVFYKLIKTGEYFRISDRRTRKNLLPVKIIGYSSGMNELISNPFMKMKLHYFNEYKRNIENKYKDDIEGSRMFYMDYEANALILVSNYLIHDGNKIDVINEILNLNRLHSFRIVINLEGTDIDETYKINEKDTVESVVDKLKKCATCYDDMLNITVSSDIPIDSDLTLDTKKITLDFFMEKATIDAFKWYFNTASELYSVFYTLNSLHLEKIPNYQSGKILEHKSASTISGMIPKTADNDQDSDIYSQDLIHIDFKSLVKECNKL